MEKKYNSLNKETYGKIMDRTVIGVTILNYEQLNLKIKCNLMEQEMMALSGWHFQIIKEFFVFNLCKYHDDFNFNQIML